MTEANKHGAAPERAALERADGDVVVSAIEAMLKGVLESQIPIQGVFGPTRGSFRSLERISRSEDTQRLFRAHGCRLTLSNEPRRAIELAARSCMQRRNVLLMLAAGDLLNATAALARARAVLQSCQDFSLALLVEDDLEHRLAAAPVRFLEDLGIARLEPDSVAQLRDMVEDAIALSQAGGAPVAILASSTILRSIDTIPIRPNRVVETLDAVAAARGRRRRPRTPDRATEENAMIALGRRLELNSATALPSPGERAPLGLIAVGPANASAEHLLRRFNLTGRVPLLRIGLAAPLDASVVSRLLARCNQVILLESRPGLTVPGALAAAEQVRRAGNEVATLWWRELPPRGDEAVTLEDGDALRASRLARKIAHMLDDVATGQSVSRELAAPDPQLEQMPVPARGSSLGIEGALRTIRNLLLSTAQWLREHAGVDGERPIELLFEADALPGPDSTVVQAEVWDRERFLSEGALLLDACGRDPTRRLIVVCDVGDEHGGDLERLATAAVPSEHSERIRVRTTVLEDLDAVLEQLRESALADGVTVLIARDGVPPRFDQDAIERSFREVDRLGFTPAQRITRPSEQACSLRPPLFADLLGTGIDRHGDTLETQLRVDTMPRRLRQLALFRIRPMTEQVEVIRTRPPLVAARGSARPAPPTMQFGNASIWRCHVSGVRGSGRGGETGLLPQILCDAGRAMGYRVGCVMSSEQAGPGRNAWAQLLFTRPREGAAPVFPLAIPYGEADLLLGIDPVETLRALGPDRALRVAAPNRTHAVVNLGLLADEAEHSNFRLRRTDESLEDAIEQRCVSGAWCSDIVGTARRVLLTERLLDMLLLGVAWQRGLIPISRDALEAALLRAEETQFGRLLEAFRYGRQLASGVPAAREAQQTTDVDRVIRRLVRDVRAQGMLARRRASRLEALMRSALQAMPGLQETALGRPAAVDFVVALRHALAWGGLAAAVRYADLIRGLYDADSGARGRRMTCYAVYPLAEAMLIRDPFYISTMICGQEQRRRIRHRLAVRHARGDRVHRRYLTRFELILGTKRARFDVRSTDWMARVGQMIIRLVPRRWRGTPTEQALSRELVTFAQRGAAEASKNPEAWERAMLRLNLQAEMGRLRSIGSSELHELLTPGFQSSDAPSSVR